MVGLGVDVAGAVIVAVGDGVFVAMAVGVAVAAIVGVEVGTLVGVFGGDVAVAAVASKLHIEKSFAMHGPLYQSSAANVIPTEVFPSAIGTK